MVGVITTSRKNTNRTVDLYDSYDPITDKYSDAKTHVLLNTLNVDNENINTLNKDLKKIYKISFYITLAVSLLSLLLLILYIIISKKSYPGILIFLSFIIASLGIAFSIVLSIFLLVTDMNDDEYYYYKNISATSTNKVVAKNIIIYNNIKVYLGISILFIFINIFSVVGMVKFKKI
jgi:hypothetical protein